MNHVTNKQEYVYIFKMFYICDLGLNATAIRLLLYIWVIPCQPFQFPDSLCVDRPQFA